MGAYVHIPFSLSLALPLIVEVEKDGLSQQTQSRRLELRRAQSDLKYPRVDRMTSILICGGQPRFRLRVVHSIS
jgi:hypothetical protein